MSQTLNIRSFPLHGSRLIEASAGTGKTYTIALLYTRLILQHGASNAFTRALNPDEILVVTFTDAATQELKDRIRSRLSEAAHCFISANAVADDDLLS
ncbi:MAG: UvrD-helicase domain-containing protein, partial [Pseudohongiella sp.]|nr:UvrD-helicase domain-containing protein [Pseudohongiella sp.]